MREARDRYGLMGDDGVRTAECPDTELKERLFSLALVFALEFLLLVWLVISTVRAPPPNSSRARSRRS